MKKVLLTAAIVAMLVAPSMASMQVQVSLDDPSLFGTTSGGEFLVTALTNLPPSGYVAGAKFTSYCLETDEGLADDGIFWAEISDRAVFGGANVPNPPPALFDPLDARTAYLFTNYAPLVDTDVKANDLQMAIWFIEEEIGINSLSVKAKAMVAEADEATTLGLDSMITWSGLGNVRVLQLWSSETVRDINTRRQDLLIVIPAPGAALLGFLGLGLVGWVKRRFA